MSRICRGRSASSTSLPAVLLPAPGTIRATVELPHATAQLVRAPGVLPADGKRRVVLYLHGGAFLTCGVNSHSRVVNALSKFADSPVLVVNYRLIPKHSVGMALDDCHDAYRWLRLRGYQPEQIVLAGDSAGGYLALALGATASAGARGTGCAGGDLAAAAAGQGAQAGAPQHQDRCDVRRSKAFDALIALVARAAGQARRRRKARSSSMSRSTTSSPGCPGR